MVSSAVRSLLARSTVSMRVSPLISTRFEALGRIHNTLVALVRPGPERAFSVSAHVRSPAATTTKTKTAAKKKPVARKSSATTKTAAKKKTTTRAATKKKTTTTKKKAAPKKRKVAAKKKKVIVKKKVKAKKLVPKKLTPRTDPSLRPPPRSMSAFTLYVKRMWSTLSPKPTSAVQGLAHVRTMWGAMNAQEKKPFEEEAAVISAERKATYDQWRASLSPAEVKAINLYRAKTKHHKLGPRQNVPKRPLQGYVKFYTEKLGDGTIDPAKKPEGTQFVVYASKEASRLWKTMSDAEKQAYKV